MKIAPDMPRDSVMIVNLSGRGDKDVHTVAEMNGGRVAVS
jgi:tryptophan synthase beta chain